MARPRTKLYFLEDEGILVTEDGTMLADVKSIERHIATNGSSWTIRMHDIESVRESTYAGPEAVDVAVKALQDMERDLDEDSS